MKRTMKVFGWVAAAAISVAAVTMVMDTNAQAASRGYSLPDVVVTADRLPSDPVLVARDGRLPDVVVVAGTGTVYTIDATNAGGILPDVIVTAQSPICVNPSGERRDAVAEARDLAPVDPSGERRDAVAVDPGSERDNAVASARPAESVEATL